MHSVAVRMQLAHTPLGARGAAAAVARGRVEDARSDHGAQSRLPQRLAPEAPSRWCGRAKQLAKQAIGLYEGIGLCAPARGVCRTHVHWHFFKGRLRVGIRDPYRQLLRFGGMKRFVDCIVCEVPEGGKRGVRWALSPGPRARTSKRVPRLCLARSSARATRSRIL